jgi:hypothetical protein
MFSFWVLTLICKDLSNVAVLLSGSCRLSGDHSMPVERPWQPMQVDTLLSPCIERRGLSFFQSGSDFLETVRHAIPAESRIEDAHQLAVVC